MQKVVVVLQIALRCEREDLVSLHAEIPLRHGDSAVYVESEVADFVDARVKEVDCNA